MTSEGATVRRLGELTPHLTYVGTHGRDFVDPSPIVLWGRERPAAILHLHVGTEWGKGVQTIAPIEKHVKVPGFPVTVTMRVPDGARSEDVVDGMDTRALAKADLDGDGVEELVVLLRHGGVQVHSVRGPLAQYPSPGGGFRRFLAQIVRLGVRDIVYALSVSRERGAADRNLLLRVDGSGVRRVMLEGLEKAEVLALGAVQRSGSQEVDELLVVTANGEPNGEGLIDASMARYRPDGKAIAPARRMYVRFPRECAFRFVPGTSRAVLEIAGGVLVIAPEKPANWIHEIKESRVPPRDLRVHRVADLEGEPKLVYGVKDELWAVDRDGNSYGPAGAGRWERLPNRGPYLKVPIPAGEERWFVWQDEGERFFAVSSRERGLRPMTHEDWRRAADRHLPPAEAEALRKRAEPTLEGESSFRDAQIKRERDERHVGEVRSVEEWRRLLPRSFAEVSKRKARDYDIDVELRFRALCNDPRAAAEVPDPAALRTFLDELEVPAHTTFMLIEGTAVSSAGVPGQPMRRMESEVGGGVEYLLHDGRVTAVLTLEKGDPAGKDPPAFFLVEAPLAARR